MSSFVLFVAILLVMIFVTGDIIRESASILNPLFLIVLSFSLGLIGAILNSRQFEPRSPWTAYSSTYEWIIHDPDGLLATMNKHVSGVCRSGNTVFIQEWYYGNADKPQTSDCKHSHGEVVHISSFADKHFFLIALKRLYQRGDIYNFTFSRILHNSFTSRMEWVSVFIDNRIIGPIKLVVRIPIGATIISARTKHSNADGHVYQITDILSEYHEIQQENSLLSYYINLPLPNTTYLIEWEWLANTTVTTSTDIK